MISTVSEFLQALLAREKAVLERQPFLNHSPMLGDMYEGLARHVLENSFFTDLNLHVSEGKIRDANGKLSGQLDCVVSIGEGERLPYTNHFIHDYPNVVAIVEVKKTFYGTELSDSFLHLREVKEQRISKDIQKLGLIRDSWRSLIGRPLPTGIEIDELSQSDSVIWHTLITEAHQPIRIVLGYDGYVSELQLRKGMIGFLETHLPPETSPRVMANWGINSFPNLIICGNASLLKLDGMPFGVALQPDGFWPFLASRSQEPIGLLLELLWTRLAYRFKIAPAIFGEDLECETVNPLLEARWHVAGNGWEYRIANRSGKHLSNAPTRVAWQPSTISKAECVALNLIDTEGGVRLDDPAFVKMIKECGMTPEQLAGSLNQKRLAYVVGGKLKFLTELCRTAILPDGRFMAGEDKTGRFTRWMNRYSTERKATKLNT